MKPKTTKIIKLTSLITSLTLIAGLIVTIITLALVKVDLKPQIDFAQCQGMEIYNGTSTSVGDFSNDNNDTINVVNAFNSSFKTSLLNALSNGYKKEPYTISKHAVALTSLETTSAKCAIFRYAATQSKKYLKNNDGSLFRDDSNNPVEYYRVAIVIEEGFENFGEVNIYFTTTVSASSTSYKITGHGNFTELNNVLEEIINR